MSNYPPLVHYETFQLERMKVAAQSALSQQHLHQAVEVDSYVNQVQQQLVLRLSTEVLAEKVLSTDQTIDWTGKVKRTVPAYTSYKHPWIPFVLAGGMAVAAIPLANLAMFIASLVLALWAVYALAANPPGTAHEEELPVSGKVVVPATYWRKFPHATIRYPDNLGPMVMYQEIEPAYFLPDPE